jgi:transposase
MEYSEVLHADLDSMPRSDAYDGSVAWRIQIVRWHAAGHSVAEIARMAKTTKPTVYKWINRYASSGVAGLESRRSTGRPRTVPGEVRSRILALSRESPPEHTGLTHWSSCAMAQYLRRHEGIWVSHNFVSVLWRENGLQPHRMGTSGLPRARELAESDQCGDPGVRC